MKIPMIDYKRASILVLSVWIMVIFSIFALGLYNIVSSQLKLTKRVQERATCYYLAKAAVIYAQTKEQKDQTSYDTLYKLKAQEENEMGRGKFIYVLTDEESKININTTGDVIMARLPGLNPELAQKIIISPLKPFAVKEEILLVDGITEEIYDGLKDIITVYGEGKVNINTAGTNVLAVLGLNESMAVIIRNFCAGADEQEATEDDEVFESTGEIIDKLRAYASLPPGQEDILAALISQGIITTQSKNFSMAVDTLILDKPAMKYNIVVDKYRIKQWSEF